MAGALTATTLSSLEKAIGSTELTIYISYDQLRLSAFRNLTNDVEAIYNAIDRHLADPLAVRTPLIIRQVDTGRSITLVAAGAPLALHIFGLLLGAVHSVWGATTFGLGTAYGGAKGLIELRNNWLDGNKTIAETGKLKAETRKAIAETNKANTEATKISLDVAKSFRELDPENRALHLQQPDVLVDRLISRLRVIANTPAIKTVEIKAGGKNLALRDGEEGTTLLDQE